ncbi:MAG: OmpA family protein [Flavobacteriales bacterium]|nr:OmpA family protein [Flavobacteriales bacterium]
MDEFGATNAQTIRAVETTSTIATDTVESKEVKAATRRTAKQAKAQAKADDKYTHYAYINAIAAYEKMANEGYKTRSVLERLGNAYYYNSDYKNSNKWYKELFSTIEKDSITPEVYYRYAQTLKSTGDFKSADKYMEEFLAKKESDTRGQKYTEKKNYLEEIESHSGRYDIEAASVINSEYSDYGATSYNGYVVFTSSRDTSGLFRRRHSWTNQSFTNLYTAKQDENGKLSDPIPFIKKVKGRYHESTPVISKDGKTIYFTRNNVEPGKQGKSSDDTRLLKIYKATMKDGKWQDAKPLPFNSNNYNCAHPALSKDEKTLYFASDMPGSIGQSDIYKVSINGDSYGKPENLGEVINTEGKETFPYETINGELYFTSDGHPGLGGFDIYGTRKEKDSTYQRILNVGKPVNGPSDDFAYIIDYRTKRGYFSSNREGGKGYDDIYNLLETRPLFECTQLLAGVVTSKETGDPVANAKVTLYDLNLKPLGSVTTNAKGEYTLDMVECDSRYYLRAEEPDFYTQDQYVSIPYERGVTAENIVLEPYIAPIPIGTDLFKFLKLNEILFDLAKWDIRPDAAVELDKIVKAMKELPDMEVAIGSHTDSRGSDSYNEKLSEKRAQSTRQYIITQGIEPHRLTAKGYGEYKLLNRCKNGVKCSSEEHQENRRSEFIVVKM